MINGVGGATGAGPMFEAPGGTLGKQEFLQMLVAQLTNQDPMNPMRSDEFAVQLAQFSNVEQLILANEQLAAQAAYSQALAQAMNSSGAVGVLGHDVLAVGDRIQVRDGEAAVTVDVGGSGGAGVVRIYDEANSLVGEMEVGSLGAGRHTLSLDGLQEVGDGSYRYELVVTDMDGAEVGVTHFVRGTVSGVKYGKDGPVLLIGTMEVPLNAVVEVSVT